MLIVPTLTSKVSSVSNTYSEAIISLDIFRIFEYRKQSWSRLLEYSVCLIKLQIFPDLGIFNCLVICMQMMTRAKYIIYFTYSFNGFLKYGALIFFNGSYHLFHIFKGMSTQFLDLNNLSIPNHLQHSGLKKLIDKL